MAHSSTNYTNNPRNNTNPRHRRISLLLLLPIVISILSTILLSTKMMSTLNNNNNIDNKFSSTFDNVFGNSIKRVEREIELDYLTGSGAPPNNVGDIRNAEQSNSNNIIPTSTNNNKMVSNKGSRTARYHAIKDARQQQLPQPDNQAATVSDYTTQRRDEAVNKSSKVVHKQLFKPQDEKTTRQQLFKPEEEDDIGNTIELESTADIEVDENNNLSILQQSTGVSSSVVEIANINPLEIETNNDEAEDIKSRENGPRPRRNPKGIRWNGWFVDNDNNSRGSGGSRWIESGKLDIDHDGIDDRDELGDYEIEGSIRDEIEDSIIDKIEDRVEEWAKTNERMVPRNVGDNNAW